jgi:uncharacterized membrane protein
MMVMLCSVAVACIVMVLSGIAGFFLLAMPGFYAVMFIGRQGIHELNWHVVQSVNFVLWFGIVYLLLLFISRRKRKSDSH